MKVQIDTSKLKQLKDNLQKNILKKAIRAGTKLVIADVRAHTPVDSGALKKSLASKVDAVKGSTSVYGLVGPRSKFTKQVGKSLKKPSRYAHFVEEGRHKSPFLIPAWEAGKKQYLDAVTAVIALEIQKELSK